MSRIPTSQNKRTSANLTDSQIRKRIGSLLVDAGLITPGQLNEALSHQQKGGGKTVQSLIGLGHLNDLQFVDFLARQPGVPSISLQNCRITPEILALVPEELAVKHEVFPIDRMGSLLTVGMVCPIDLLAVEKLEEATGLRVKPMLCKRGEVNSAIERYYHKKQFETTHVERRARPRRAR